MKKSDAIRLNKRYEKEKCRCPGCLGLPTADPKYGYDRAKVPAIECIACGKPIGDEEFIEIDGMARFGIMEFQHKRCFTKASIRSLSRQHQKEIREAGHAIRS